MQKYQHLIKIKETGEHRRLRWIKMRGAYAWEPCVVMKEKIALLSGHPNPTRFCLVLTHEYADVAR